MRDTQLLEQYARERSEPAFAELVRRHIDLVYSVALRVVNGDTHLAQDVTQTVFVDLARRAAALPRDVVLPGWLHRHTSWVAAKAVRTERRRKARELTAMEIRALEANGESGWERIAPHLDAGLDQLSVADRNAIVLRFFKRQDLREVGAALGVSEDAAQKRVSRALEKLRLVLNRRGVALTGAGLASALAAEAVAAAPSGLAASVAAASLAGAAAPGTMATLLQLMSAAKIKTGIVSAIVVASIVTPVMLQQQAQGRLREQDEALRVGGDRLTALYAESARLSNLFAQAQDIPRSGGDQSTELLRLRGEVARLRNDLLERSRGPAALSRNEVLASLAGRYSERINQFKEFLAANPAEGIPELQFMTEKDWLWLAGEPGLNTGEAYREALSRARLTAEGTVTREILHPALKQYALEHNGQFPTEISQLKPYFKSPLDDAILQRWQILPASKLINLRDDLRDESWVITQKAPINRDLDQRIVFGVKESRMFSGAPPKHWDVAP